MQGKLKVIALLNEALQEELTAITQYFLHAEMCDNWHYDKLSGYIKKLSIVEMKHAEALIERILFLDGTPNLTELLKLYVGRTSKNRSKATSSWKWKPWRCTTGQSRPLVTKATMLQGSCSSVFLKAEEGHVDWLEAQLHQIGEIGYERYLSQQIREEK